MVPASRASIPKIQFHSIVLPSWPHLDLGQTCEIITRITFIDDSVMTTTNITWCFLSSFHIKRRDQIWLPLSHNAPNIHQLLRAWRIHKMTPTFHNLSILFPKSLEFCLIVSSNWVCFVLKLYIIEKKMNACVSCGLLSHRSTWNNSIYIYILLSLLCSFLFFIANQIEDEDFLWTLCMADNIYIHIYI